ncbi:MAG: 2-phospho-L-lactate guanylyltransferase [Chloroflexi bacterium UTCFX4]|nr:MAG: 2-phospho-L-lactate guanylyltransferase [Chloroflexi bacterium UTCFX4]
MDSLVAIVPVKPFAESKTRLAGVLNETERVALARKLLERTLLKLTRARGLARVVVISRDEKVLKIARKFGAWSILETNTSLNDALDQARRVCIANGARALLILPADLPKLRVRDVENIIALGEPAPRVVLAPAQRDGGTNALLLNPAHDFVFQFGENSFSAHMGQVTGSKYQAKIYASDTVVFDVDVPEDLEIAK